MNFKNILRLGCLLMAPLTGTAQEHKWAGRTLNDVEWSIHEKLATLPSHGVFDNLTFEVTGDAVVLNGQVMKESSKANAERALHEMCGDRRIDNRIEVLPPSRRDDVLRMNVFRAVYQSDALAKYGARQAPSIYIIVKHGWVTLGGVVDSVEDPHAASTSALTVTPHVFDYLRVAPEST